MLKLLLNEKVLKLQRIELFMMSEAFRNVFFTMFSSYVIFLCLRFFRG